MRSRDRMMQPHAYGPSVMFRGGASTWEGGGGGGDLFYCRYIYVLVVKFKLVF